MLRKPYIKKRTWTPDEDHKLIAYIMRFGIWNWNKMPKFAGLQRSGKSCRLRWMNYLRPNVRRGNFSREEEETIIRLQKQLGNRWSAIAARLPHRTDNDVKNYWNTRLKKRVILENNKSETKSSMEENSPDHADSSTLLNIPTMAHFPEPFAYNTTFSSSGCHQTKEVDNSYSMRETFVSSENYWEILSFLEQSLMTDDLDWEAVSPSSQLWHSHHQHYYDPVLDFWVNSLI
ncbi:hypothetical protein GQ457_08G008370 [Hibiscus cannabinus]